MKRYGKPFFDLQLRFAQGVSARSGMPLERALLDYTNFYVRFGLGRAFDDGNPLWRAYLEGLQHAADPLDWSYDFYLTRPAEAGAPPVAATSGCFSYAEAGGGCIRLHFENVEQGGRAPLTPKRQAQRLAELRALFMQIRKSAPPGAVQRVAGTSWLYNLAGYRALFPAAYLASAVPAGARFRNMPLWGQFLNRQGEIRKVQAETLLRRLGGLSNIEGLAHCFPFQALALEAPVSAFYEFHGV
jgi:hypothetical protein